MEGVGARLGRSSSRYGATTVFSGPVRKWKKNWVPITPPYSTNSNQNHHSNGSLNASNGGAAATSAASHLRLYKWTPLSKDNNSTSTNNNHNSSSSPNNGKLKRSPSDDDNNNNVNNGSDSPVKDDDALPEEPPRRKFKYIPVAVLEEQKKKDEENSEDEAKPIDADDDNGEHASKSDGYGEKPDINDVPMEENQDSEENQTAPTRQDLNELDLSLGLTSLDEEQEPDAETDPNNDGQPDSAKVGV